MNKEALKQILDAMRLHTAETHPLVETERAMEAIEAELAQPQTMRPVELAERLKQGEKWAVVQEQPAQQEPVAQRELIKELADQYARECVEFAKAIPSGAHSMSPIAVKSGDTRLSLHTAIDAMTATPQPAQRQPLTTDEYVQALGPLLSQIVCSSGTLHCIVRTIEALHGIKEQP